MPFLTIQVSRKAHYVTYQGNVEEVTFKAFKKFWARQCFCLDCTKKLKTHKDLLPQEQYLAENDLCMNCCNKVSF